MQYPLLSLAILLTLKHASSDSNMLLLHFSKLYNIIVVLIVTEYVTITMLGCAVLCLVTQSCPILCNPMDPMDYSPPGSSVHDDSPGILSRILEWVAMLSFRGSSQPRDQAQVSHTGGGFFMVWDIRAAQQYWSG